MNVFVGRRSEVGSFAARYTVPIGLFVVMAVLILVRPAALAVTVSGLILDVLGATTLAIGILLGAAARIRMWRRESEEPISRLPWWSRWCAAVPVTAANRLAGSMLSTSSSDIEDVTDTFWGLALLAVGFVAQAFGAWLQTAPSGEIWSASRSPRPAVSAIVTDPTTAILYALSTIAQTCAALAAFVGAVGLFRLQLLLNSRERTEDAIRQAMAPRISKERSLEEIVKAARDLLNNSPEMLTEIERASLLKNLPQLEDIPHRYGRARCWLIGFEAWTLAVIAATLIGFGLVSNLASAPLLATTLLCVIALGTAGITFWCVLVWTKG